MRREKETRPAAGKHSGRIRKSNQIVAQNEAADSRIFVAYYVGLALLVIWGAIVSQVWA